MNSKTLSCAKCGSTMEPGFILEKDYATRDKPSEWIGSSEDTVIKTGLFGGKAKKKTYPIATYRCTSCGFLESYAGPT